MMMMSMMSMKFTAVRMFTSIMISHKIGDSLSFKVHKIARLKWSPSKNHLRL